MDFKSRVPASLWQFKTNMLAHCWFQIPDTKLPLELKIDESTQYVFFVT